MAREFKAVDRETPMLLPPDLRQWLPEDHLVYLVLTVVKQLDLSVITDSYRRGGPGREAFDPALLTALLIYAYSQGIRSSRQNQDRRAGLAAEELHRETLRKMAADIVDEATATDAADDAEFGPDRSGDELPEDLRPGADRAARIRRALAQVEADEQELAQAKAGQGRRAQTANSVGNVSDPDSHVMFVRGKGFLQG